MSSAIVAVGEFPTRQQDYSTHEFGDLESPEIEQEEKCENIHDISLPSIMVHLPRLS